MIELYEIERLMNREGIQKLDVAGFRQHFGAQEICHEGMKLREVTYIDLFGDKIYVETNRRDANGQIVIECDEVAKDCRAYPRAGK